MMSAADQEFQTKEKARLWDFFNERLLSRSGIVLSNETDCQNAVNQWADAHEAWCNRNRVISEAKRIVQGGITLHTVSVPHADPVATYSGVEFSRYTIEWTNAPLPVGTKFYAAPVGGKESE